MAQLEQSFVPPLHPEKLVEEGTAVRALAAERHPVVVIGGGQAGLAAGHYLARCKIPFVILDAGARTGDAWRRRWDSLRLFTPARYDSLPGLRFPAPPSSFPTKDAMADYLEAYANRFELPIRHGVEVTRLYREGERYVVLADGRRFEAEHVIVATSQLHVPRVPADSRLLVPVIRQIHSAEYKSPSDLRAGPVLVVGAGNSGAEIALELAREGRKVFLSGRDTGRIPFRIESVLSRVLLVHIVLRVVFHRILTLSTPIGRRVRKNVAGHGGALIRTNPADLVRAGVVRVPRVRGVKGGLPEVDDGRVLDVANVIWCTGFEPGFSWIQLPIFDGDGTPKHARGVVADEPGLYFLGLPFLYAMSSIMIHGVARDAARVVRTIASRYARKL